MRERGIIRKQGRLTIPKRIREQLGIKNGTYYEMEVYGKKKDKLLITIMG